MASRLARVNAVTVNDVLDGRKLLEIDCVDRVYLTLSVPNLVVGGQVVNFLTVHERNPIPSPVLLERRGLAFRRAVASFAEANDIPVLSFAGKREKGRPGVLAESPWPERKIDKVMPLMRKAAATGRSQVVAIGVAQEYQRVFTGTKDQTATGAVWFSYNRTERRVTCYYFYVWDEGFGPAFIKVCAWFPYPGKIWVNGHEADATGTATVRLPPAGVRGAPAAKKITTNDRGSLPARHAGQGTMQLMARLSDTAKITLQRRVAAHHAQHWPQLSSLDVRWRGSYAYIDAVTPHGDVQQLCRLKWNGHHDHWEFAIYLASRDGYEPNILPSGWPTGTPEEAIDCAGLLYLNDWTQPPKD